MKSLTIRNKTLLLQGASVTGNLTDGYNYIEESLYAKDAIELREFCEWIDKNVGGASSRNIDKLFDAFKNPNDTELQKYVADLKERINSFKR